MKKFMVLIFVALIAFTSIGFSHKTYKVYDKLILLVFKNKFIEPFENLYLLTYDLTLYKVTSNQEGYVDFDMRWLKNLLKKNGHKIADVMIIIHNHPPTAPRGFSRADIHTWYEFKREGFAGNYYLYLSGFNLIFELRENKDDC